MIFGKVNLEELDKSAIIEFGGPKVGTSAGPFRIQTCVNVPEAWVVVEDFMPGQEADWAFHYNEVHLILDGKAEITYTLPADGSTKIFKAVAEKGDTYLIPCGARVHWKVVSKEPYRHYCVIMPRYSYEKWQRDAVKEEKSQ